MKSLMKIILTFGMRGDYNTIRYYAKRTFIFWPLYKLYETFHGSYLPLNNNIQGEIFFPHEPCGVFLSMHSVIGKDCIIMQHVTIGSNFVNKGQSGRAPKIGNNVFIGAGAKIIGKVRIGSNVKIGAGCIVVTDIPDNAVVVMNKPRILIK